MIHCSGSNNFNRAIQLATDLATKPFVEVNDPKRAFISQWLAGVFIVVLPIGYLVAVGPDILTSMSGMLDNGDLQVLTGSFFLLLLCYVLCRLGHYEWAMTIATAIASIVIFRVTILASNEDVDDLAFLLMPIIVLSVLVPRKVMIMFILLDVLVWLGIGVFSKDLSLGALLGNPFTVFVVGSTLTLFISYHREALENLNMQTLREANINLQSEIAERKRIEAELQKSLSEKETLLREIHHRVKNNLQVISSLLRLQVRSAQSEQIADMLIDSQNRVRAMAFVHEQLYRSHDLSKIDAHDYIHELLKHLLQSQKQLTGTIELDMRVDRLALHVDFAIPCGLLVNELVSNAMKHAFQNSKEGTIFVEFHGVGNSLLLVVKDTGIGFPEHIDVRNARTMGLQLINSLVRQLNGELRLHVQHGTTFTIEFPKPMN